MSAVKELCRLSIDNYLQLVCSLNIDIFVFACSLLVQYVLVCFPYSRRYVVHIELTIITSEQVSIRVSGR